MSSNIWPGWRSLTWLRKRWLQRDIALAVHDRLLSGGILVLGKHERLPPGVARLVELVPHLRIYRKEAGPIP